MTTFRWGSATDTGRVRSNNQDSLLVVDDQLFAVADGMGGHSGGEVASALALEVLEAAVDGDATSTTASLVAAVRSANDAVFERAGGDESLRGMGTTLTAIAPVGDSGGRLAVVNVGDSRLYRVRDDELEQLTDDHSLVASLVRQGRITAEEAEDHPQRNILTRALGIDQTVQVDSWEIEPSPGDRYLLCSDGLFNEVDEARIVATLRRLGEPDDAAAELVRLALDGGGRDNVTCVIVDVLEAPGAAATAGAGGAAVADEPQETTARHRVVAADEEDGRPRRFTWRVALFFIALLALVASVAGALGWYARNTYFVAVDDGSVTIFKGRPGGFLWFDPTVEQRTDIAAEDVPPRSARDLEDGVDRATLADAEAYVANLERQIDRAVVTRTPTTTTAPGRDSGSGAGERLEGGGG